jgi:hypothetical protein
MIPETGSTSRWRVPMGDPDTPVEASRSSVRASEGSEARRGRGDGGAVIVEFAIVAPLLLLLVFGVIEFGNAYVQLLDVRHGAREGARLAAVNANPANAESPQANRIAKETCARMDVDGSQVKVSIDVDGSSTGDPLTNDIGDQVTVKVEKPLDQLTGFLSFALSNKKLSSSVQTRLEQKATYVDSADFLCT